MQIVAPAGSFSGLRASIKAGADAVYLGMPQFGARAKAENFNEQTLKEAVEYAHLLGVKVFITLNTLIKDDELYSAVQTAKFAYAAGVDAAIVQDLKLIKALKHSLPDFTLHASTQMGVHNRNGAEVLFDLGIKRAVLARETLPNDIAEIKKTGLEIEYFVQGALCVCFSGNCYFSSLASSFSGNRGKCMQLCRKKYIWHNKSGYYLSAKDLCLYDKLAMLSDLGVDAIKIEGRMRSDEYAYRAVSIYKSNMPTDEAVSKLKDVFNRGDYCSGYLTDNAQFNIIYSKAQSNIGAYIGKIDKIQGNRLSVHGFIPHVSDGFKIMRGGDEVCGAAVRNGFITSDGKCSVGDEVRRTFNGALSEEVKHASARKLNVDIKVTLAPNEYPEITLKTEKTVTRIIGEQKTESAVSRGITEADINRVFDKVSEYPFTPQISTVMHGDVFTPISSLNELRRRAYAQLKSDILENYRINRSELKYKGLNYNKFNGHGVILSIESGKQLTDEIIRRVDYIVLNPRDYSSFEVPKVDKPILLNTPITMRGEDKDVIKKAIDRDGICGVVSNNLYTLKLTVKPILLGIGHNIIGDCELPHIRSVEVDNVAESECAFDYVFGYAPVMTLCHCPYGKCISCSGADCLTDERGRKFTMRRYKTGHCYWQLLNCVPHYTVNKAISENKFFDCTAVDSRTILSALCGEYTGEFTRGNINKGLK